MQLFIDTETYSEHDLTTVGAYKYAEGVEVMIVTYAADNQPVKCWDVTDDPQMPEELAIYLSKAARVIAHNSQFDRTMLRLGQLRIDIPIEKWHCTATQARAHGLPPALEDLGHALGLDADQTKIADGKRLIQLFCKPRPRSYKLHRATANTHPQDWAMFIEYAIQDVATMRECYNRMPSINYSDKSPEMALWFLDQRINDRGFRVDIELTQAAIKASASDKQELVERFLDLTEGQCRPTQRQRAKEYINERFGLSLTSTDKSAMEGILADRKADPVLHELAEIILASNKTSMAKFEKLAAYTSDDGRMRGTLLFDGASRTRRWSGRGFQPQNLPSRGLPSADETTAYIDAVKAGVHDLVFTDRMRRSSAIIRGLVIADEGKQIVASDLSNIEGRKLAWLANEQPKLKAFREFDAGTGPDLYNITATSILGGDPYDVDKAVRNAFGKVPELALGFGGGPAGLQTFAVGYGVSFAEHMGTIQQSVDAATVQQAREAYDHRGRESGIEKDEWIASEIVKVAWRRKNPEIVRLWALADQAARSAITQPDTWFQAGPRLRYRLMRKQTGNYLICELPSGRYLTYYDPQIIDGTITYMGDGAETDGTARGWFRLRTYGGKLVANATQSTARDVLADAMPKVEAAGYEILLSIHDELVTQSTKGPEELSRILAAGHEWTKGLPLAAAGFAADRYRKD